MIRKAANLRRAIGDGGIMGRNKLATTRTGETADKPAATMPNAGLRWMLGAAVGLSTAALASAGVAAPSADASPSHPAVQVGQICRDTVGLAPGGRAFSDCVEALSQSAASLAQASVLRNAHEHCLKEGVQPDGPALAKCEVAATGGEAAVFGARQDNSAASAARPAISSYFSVSWREAHQRRRMACAALGHSPESSGFYNCVASLQAALFRAEHPST